MSAAGGTAGHTCFLRAAYNVESLLSTLIKMCRALLPVNICPFWTAQWQSLNHIPSCAFLGCCSATGISHHSEGWERSHSHGYHYGDCLPCLLGPLCLCGFLYLYSSRIWLWPCLYDRPGLLCQELCNLQSSDLYRNEQTGNLEMLPQLFKCVMMMGIYSIFPKCLKCFQYTVHHNNSCCKPCQVDLIILRSINTGLGGSRQNFQWFHCQMANETSLWHGRFLDWILLLHYGLHSNASCWGWHSLKIPSNLFKV